MGNFAIVVHGVGPHDNQDNPTDADKMAADFVHKLTEAGHHISHASITVGGRKDIVRAIPSVDVKS